MHRVFSLPERLPRPARARQDGMNLAGRASSCARRGSRCTRSMASIANQVLKEELGIGLCNITKCCTEVCPEDIHITDNAIIPLKERVVDEYYDPLLMLVRKIRGVGKS